MCKVYLHFMLQIPSITWMFRSSPLLVCRLQIQFPMGAFKLCSFIVIGMIPVCIGGTFKEDFTTALLCHCSVSCVSQK